MFKEYQKVYKIIMLGSASTGKTSLLKRFVDDEYKNDQLATVGMDLKFLNLKICETPVRLQVWDTQGQEKYQSITRHYFRGCQGAVICYDITRSDSLQGV
mmetsp:Transcript_34146/g.24656  ORF Transcript_34146/g.24656 Transcript_34146/m.24656 type:complete len:100 (+) Transcript_34146:457-756(+)